MASQVRIKIEEGVVDENDAEKDSAPAKRLRWAEEVDGSTAEMKGTGPDSATPTTNTLSSRRKNDHVKDGTTKKVYKCSFCGHYQAAVLMKASWKGKRQPLCMLHYYTTAAVHAEPQHIKVLDAALVETQLKGQPEEPSNTTATATTQENLNVQDLFAEAFVQLKQDLTQASLTIAVEPAKTQKKNPRKLDNDPLGMLHDLGKNKKRRLVHHNWSQWRL